MSGAPFPIFLGGRWRWVRTPAELLQALEELTAEMVDGSITRGLPPPVAGYHYQLEPRAMGGPRKGSNDDRWLPWWKLPRKKGSREGDCEDLAAAWVARMRLLGYDAWPAVLRTPDGWHATAMLRHSGGPHRGSPEGPLYTETPMRGTVVDAAWIRGMKHPAGRWPGWEAYEADPDLYFEGVL